MQREREIFGVACAVGLNGIAQELEHRLHGLLSDDHDVLPLGRGLGKEGREPLYEPGPLPLQVRHPGHPRDGEYRRRTRRGVEYGPVASADQWLVGQLAAEEL